MLSKFILTMTTQKTVRKCDTSLWKHAFFNATVLSPLSVLFLDSSGLHNSRRAANPPVSIFGESLENLDMQGARLLQMSTLQDVP